MGVDSRPIACYCSNMNIAAENGSLSAGRRAELILDVLSTRGFSSVAALAGEMNVSEMTVRRDLAKLEADGLLRRTHGGALAQEKTQIELDYLVRQKRLGAEKDAIGRLAAGLVADGQSIFLDAGTTVLAVARHLQNFKNLTVVTTSLPVQSALLSAPSVDVILTGGKVLTPTMSLVGPIAQDAISRMRFDWTFLGAGGIDINRGLTHSTLEEIPIKQAAASGAKTAALADHNKFNYNALALFMPIDEINVIITDQASQSLQTQAANTAAQTKLLWPKDD